MIKFTYGTFNFLLQDNVNFYFETPRPEVMVLEKSTDYGVTFSAWQYYARDCAEKFPGVKTTPINRQDPTAVICTEEYAKMVSKKVTTLRPPLSPCFGTSFGLLGYFQVSLSGDDGSLSVKL